MSREAVHDAIQGPVEQATKLAADVPEDDPHTRLTILIDGWGRGLAAGLEELAATLDEVRRLRDTPLDADRSADRG
jgi:hypothetical protein